MANKKDKIEIYASRKVKGQYGWRYIAANGRKVAIAGELYTKYEHTFRMVNKLFPDTPVVDTTAKRGKFKKGDRVLINAGVWGELVGIVLRAGDYYESTHCRIAEGEHKGHQGVWMNEDIKLAPAKAKRVTKDQSKKWGSVDSSILSKTIKKAVK